MTPTALSLALMRKQGWFCELTEKNMRILRRDAAGNDLDNDLTFKQDLWGFCDILCVKRGKTVAVQATTLGNVSARIHKIQSLISFEMVKQAGWQIQVHGWHDQTKGGGVKVIDLTNAPTEWSSIVKRGPRRRNTPRVQTELRL